MSEADTLVANLTVENCGAQARAWIETELPKLPYPDGKFAGRGVVTCAGGAKYTIPAYIMVKALRHVGCTLPVELWYRGAAEYMPAFEQLMAPLSVTWIDAYRVREVHPHARLNGFEMKPYAIQWSRFAEVLFLDSDNVPVRDPTYLFDDSRVREAGTMLWPDYHRLAKTRGAWQIFGVAYRDEPEVESGQVLITDKAAAWRALCLADWYGQRSLFTFKHVYGDKELFHLCWRRLSNYVMPERGIHTLRNARNEHRTMCQHDLDGNRIFQHHNTRKWSLDKFEPCDGFLLESEIKTWLDELRYLWSPAAKTIATPEDSRAMAALHNKRLTYTRVGKDHRQIILDKNGTFANGGAGCEHRWAIRDGRLLISDRQDSLMMDLSWSDGAWRGRWLRHECMPVVIQ